MAEMSESPLDTLSITHSGPNRPTSAIVSIVSSGIAVAAFAIAYAEMLRESPNLFRGLGVAVVTFLVCAPLSLLAIVTAGFAWTHYRRSALVFTATLLAAIEVVFWFYVLLSITFSHTGPGPNIH
jgi:hypothetical protein